MSENQSQPPMVKSSSTRRRWIVLGIGLSAALLAVVVLIVMLLLSIPKPRTARAGSHIIGFGQATAVSPAVSTPIEIPSNVVIPAPRDHPQADGNKMGNPNAPVKIVEYADFQCPFCLEYWRDTEPQIIQNYIATGKVYYEYRSVGAFIGPESASAAEAAYCAGDQGKFWEYHDILFANWTGENAGDFTDDKLKIYAAALRLNLDQFSSCYTGGKYKAEVSQDITLAKADGIRATPSFVINGKIVEGAQPFAAFQQVIEADLQGP